MPPADSNLTVDGRRAEGADAVREALTAALEALRSASHRITRQWHQDEVWIAEIEATYVLQDWLEMVDLPRAVVLYDGPAGATQLHFYGAQERPLSDHPTGEEGTWLRERWIPPL
jgi:hypothetical protein